MIILPEYLTRDNKSYRLARSLVRFITGIGLFRALCWWLWFC